jgi:hypothetical protein
MTYCMCHLPLTVLHTTPKVRRDSSGGTSSDINGPLSAETVSLRDVSHTRTHGFECLYLDSDEKNRKTLEQNSDCDMDYSRELRPFIYSARSRIRGLDGVRLSRGRCRNSRIYSKKSSPDVRMRKHRKGWARAAIPSPNSS